VVTNEQTRLAGPSRPIGSPEIPQFYLPSAAARGVYVPRLYGAATIQFADRKRKIDETRRVAFLVPLEPGTRTIDWDHAAPTDVMPDGLARTGVEESSYLPLPAGAMRLNTFTRWAKGFDRWLARTQRLEVSPKTEEAEAVAIGPKRGGVRVELIAIVWGLT